MTHQLRIAVRSLLKSRTFTIVAVAVLSLAIGAGTMIFSVVDAVVLRGLPFDEHDRIVAILSVDTKRPTTFGGGSSTTQTYYDWRKLQQSFEAIAMVGNTSYRLKSENGVPADARGQRVTREFFSILRVRPLFGRNFEAGDESEGGHHVILSYGFWQSHYGSAPDAIGKTLDLNEEPWEIIGVLPRGFQYPVGSDHATDIYVPQIFTTADIARGGSHNYNAVVIGRLKSGVTLKQANDEMNRVTAALEEQYPKWEPGRRAEVTTLHEYLVGKVRGWMLMLLSAVALVLLIACANVANLMLARATVKSRETSIRRALGASRWSLIRDVVLEGLLLSGTGALLGVLLAYAGVRVLHEWLPAGLPRVATIGVDWRVLGFAVTSALVTGVLFGVIPELRWPSRDVAGGIKDGGRSTTTGVASQRLTSALVVVEIAMAVVLVVGAGLFMTSFAELVRIEPGFDYHNILTLNVGLRVNFLDRAALNEARKRGAEYVQQMTDAVRRVPGVEMAGAVSGGVPLTGSWSRNSITIAGGPELNGDDSIDIRAVSVNYISVLKIPLLRGRVLTEEDAKPGAPSVVVINKAALDKYWPGGDPLGQQVKINNVDRAVIGIVGNVRHLGPEAPFRQEAYYPLASDGTTGAALVIRTKPDPMDLLASVKSAIWSVNPEQHLTGDVVTLDSYMDRLIAERRFTMALLAIFGLLGLTIAAAGLYGLMAYVVAQRTSEIGVRMALGATPMKMLSMVLRRAVALTVTGLVIGGGAAWYLSSGVQKFLFQVKSTDLRVFAAALLTLLITGLLASAIPARRAAAVDPLVSLRHE